MLTAPHLADPGTGPLDPAPRSPVGDPRERLLAAMSVPRRLLGLDLLREVNSNESFAGFYLYVIRERVGADSGLWSLDLQVAYDAGCAGDGPPFEPMRPWDDQLPDVKHYRTIGGMQAFLARHVFSSAFSGTFFNRSGRADSRHEIGEPRTPASMQALLRHLVPVSLTRPGIPGVVADPEIDEVLERLSIGVLRWRTEADGNARMSLFPRWIVDDPAAKSAFIDCLAATGITSTQTVTAPGHRLVGTVERCLGADFGPPARPPV